MTIRIILYVESLVLIISFFVCYFNLNNTNPLANVNFGVLECFFRKFILRGSHFHGKETFPLKSIRRNFTSSQFAPRTLLGKET